MTDTAALRALLLHYPRDERCSGLDHCDCRTAEAKNEEVRRAAVNALPALLDKADALAALVAARQSIEEAAAAGTLADWGAWRDAWDCASRLVEGS